MFTILTLSKYGDKYNKNIMEFVGKRYDLKPIIKYNGVKIPNGSKFFEMDTNKTFVYDEDKVSWNDVT